jgi:hypothetical protein
LRVTKIDFWAKAWAVLADILEYVYSTIVRCKIDGKQHLSKNTIGSCNSKSGLKYKRTPN